MGEESSSMQLLFGKSLLMLLLILVSVNIAGWMKKREFKYFGETAMYITVGVATSLLFRGFDMIIEKDILKGVQLSTSFFYMVLLPPIIFEGGYSVQRSEFVRNVPLIFMLAFVGGVYSTVFIALLLYLFSGFTDHAVSLVEALIFGSLISSTDPVTILAMLPPETDRSLYMTIFGESALNDAVAIILYRFFSGLADPTLELTSGKFMMSLLESLGVFVGSFAVGTACALLYALITKHQRLTHEAEVYQVLVLIVFAYSSYLLAEVAELTGIISIFFCGMAMAHYAKPNLTDRAALVVRKMLRILSVACESFIFMYLGMGLFAFPMARYNLQWIVLALFAIALGRTHVFIVCGAQNAASAAALAAARVRGAQALAEVSAAVPPKMSLGKQIFVWFSGLRGAVAFALAVQLLDNQDLSYDTRAYIFGTAIIVIVTTVYGLNLLTPPLIKRLDISSISLLHPHAAATTNDGNVEHVSSSGNPLAAEAAEEYDEDGINAPQRSGVGGILALFYKFDSKYMRPFFCKMDSNTPAAPAAVPQPPPVGEKQKVVSMTSTVCDDTNELYLADIPSHLQYPKVIKTATLPRSPVILATGQTVTPSPSYAFSGETDTLPLRQPENLSSPQQHSNTERAAANVGAEITDDDLAFTATTAPTRSSSQLQLQSQSDIPPALPKRQQH